MTNNTPNLFGLLGKDISYSFSKSFFIEKFNNEKLNATYQNIDVKSIDYLLDFLANNIETLKGFNITIPYKEEIFQYLDQISDDAQEIGAVNCVKLIDNQYLHGFNTDSFGFIESLKPLLENQHKKALILGTGGASKAIAFSLKKLAIDFKFVSRNPLENQLSYKELNNELINEHLLIINTTPLGTKGKHENELPKIPYQYVTDKHLLYDLVYNPEITNFLQKGLDCNAKIKNGLEMLILQAEKSWEIWTNDPF